MKYLLIFFLTLCLNCGQKVSNTTVRVYSVGADIDTIFNIKCNKFFDSFDSTELKVKDWTEKSTIDDFLEKLKTLRLDTDKSDPDTRAIIIVKNDIVIDTLCADWFTIKYKDKLYTMTDELRKRIWTE